MLYFNVFTSFFIIKAHNNIIIVYITKCCYNVNNTEYERGKGSMNNRNWRFGKNIYILIFFLLALVVITYISIDKTRYEYNDYSFIDSSRRNSFNFKYPKDWYVQMMEYWEGTETQEANPFQGVYIYMDSNDLESYIEIVITHSQAPFSAKTISYDSSKEYEITKHDKMKAKVYHEDDQDEIDKMHIYITFDSKHTPFNNRVGVHVKVNKDFYSKNQNKIWKTIKSIKINE